MNPHIERAIEFYRKSGEDFGDVLARSLVGGCFLATPEFACCFHYCRKESPHVPLPRSVSNCAYISFFTGDIRRGLEWLGQQFDFIVFRRGFKNTRAPQVYPLSRFARLAMSI